MIFVTISGYSCLFELPEYGTGLANHSFGIRLRRDTHKQLGTVAYKPKCSDYIAHPSSGLTPTHHSDHFVALRLYNLD
jgi:hypothetical protein